MPFNEEQLLMLLDGTVREAMEEGLQLVRRSARQKAAYSSTIQGAINSPPVVQDGTTFIGEVRVDLEEAPMARAFEFGSGEQDRRGARLIPITAVNANALVFFWERVGTTVVFPKPKFVLHPGVQARPYLFPAARETFPKFASLLLGAGIRASAIAIKEQVVGQTRRAGQ